jgi:peptide/nickel transport system permease protein
LLHKTKLIQYKHWLFANRLTAAAAFYVVLLLVLCAGAYTFVPDASTAANRQVLDCTNLPPFTSISVLVLQPNTQNETHFMKYLVGEKESSVFVPICDTCPLSISHNKVQVRLRNGLIANYNTQEITGATHTTPINLQIIENQYIKSWFAVLGTDGFGRDIFSRLLIGGRVSLTVGILAVMVSLWVGVGLGALAGFLGGWVDSTVNWLCSVFWSLPSLVLAIGVAFVLGKGISATAIAIGLTIWVEPARIVRTQILSLREREFVKAAQVMGFTRLRIIVGHILPNLMGLIIILSCANFASAVLLESGLSFLGLGVNPPTPTWGGMIQDGFSTIVLDSGLRLALFPGMVMVLLIIALNLIAKTLRDTLH